MAHSSQHEFVQAQGGQFTLGGNPWRCVGVNAYHLMTRAADPQHRPSISALLDDCAAAGFTLVRTWAFNDGAGQHQALQTAPGQYDAAVWEALDWVVAQCAARGLRLTLALTNHWEDFGGVSQYVRWSKGLPDGAPVAAACFYADPGAQQLMRRQVEAVLTRVNAHTGRAYNREPAIAIWELINEPRCDAAASAHGGELPPAAGPGDAMRAWLAGGVAHLKSLAPRQLVTVGCEGFWGASTPELARRHNPYEQRHGCDWAQECSVPGLDVASIHLWPEHWLPEELRRDPGHVLSFSHDWVASHARYARDVLGKPLLLSEFGCRASVGAQEPAPSPGQPSGPPPAEPQQGPSPSHAGLLAACLPWLFGRPARHSSGRPRDAEQDTEGHGRERQARTGPLTRDEFVRQVLSACGGDPGRGEAGGAAGALLWMVAEAEVPDYDGFTARAGDAAWRALAQHGGAHGGGAA